MIYILGSLIPPANCQTNLITGEWVASVPLPWYPGLFERMHDAWMVFTGKAVAVRYPKPGDFERACHGQGWKVMR